MFVRGTSLPSRGELVEQRLPLAPARKAALAAGAARDGGGGRRADRLPVRLPAGADHVAPGDDHVPLGRRDHRLRRPDLRRPARARRHLRLHPLAPRHRPRRRLPAGDADRRLRGDGARRPDRLLGPARARGEPGGDHARRRGRDRAVRLPQLDLGRRHLELAGARAQARHRPRPVRPVPRHRRQGAEPGVRVLRPRLRGPARAVRRESAPLDARAADARGPLERAGGGRGGDQRPQRQARRVRDQLVHRRDQRRAVRLQLQLGHRQPLLGTDGAQPDRPRLRRRRSRWSRGRSSPA